MKKSNLKGFGLLTLIPVVAVPFLVTNCSSRTISNNESKENETRDIENNDIKTNEELNSINWDEGTNTKELSDIQKTNQKTRINDVTNLYNEYKNLTDESKIKQAINDISTKINFDIDDELYTKISSDQSPENLNNLKNEIIEVYKNNKIEYCFINFSEYKNKIETWWNKFQKIENFETSESVREWSYYGFLLFNAYNIPSYGYLILNTLLNDKLPENKDFNYIKEVKKDFDNLLKIYDNNAKNELNKYEFLFSESKANQNK